MEEIMVGMRMCSIKKGKLRRLIRAGGGRGVEIETERGIGGIDGRYSYIDLTGERVQCDAIFNAVTDYKRVKAEVHKSD
jgi:hypothetical protein